MALDPPPTQATTASGRRPVRLERLGAGLLADDAVEVAHHRRGTGGGLRPCPTRSAWSRRLATQSRNVSLIASLSVRDPGFDRCHVSAQQVHAGHVESLALHVDGPHVDPALHTHEGCRCRGGDAVLPRAGLRDEPGLAHALRQQRLAQGVVDLMAAGVVEVLALEQDAGTAGVLGEPRQPRSAGWDGPRTRRAGGGTRPGTPHRGRPCRTPPRSLRTRGRAPRGCSVLRTRRIADPAGARSLDGRTARSCGRSSWRGAGGRSRASHGRAARPASVNAAIADCGSPPMTSASPTRDRSAPARHTARRLRLVTPDSPTSGPDGVRRTVR